MTIRTQAEIQLARLEEFVRRRDYAGYDPYDALNSPIIRAICCGAKWGRIAATQTLKRCPINLRPLLGIRPGQNPKGLALFLEGYTRLYRRESNEERADCARRLVRYLAGLRTPTRYGHGWGYNFDWQSRAFFLPKHTPTVVCSSFVGHALLDAAEAMDSQEAFDLAEPVGQFFVRELNRHNDADGFCFSYSPLDEYWVHNASLLGASFLIRLHRLTGKAGLRDAALGALAYSMKHQGSDGSWRYSESGAGQWIDSFHTGFNLEAIRRFLVAGEGRDLYNARYMRAVQFYADEFFLADGAPKYYCARTYPLDIHSAAEAISFFADEGEQFAALADRVLGWTLRNLADPCGSFHFQKGRYVTNRIPYMRWGQAWMFRALARYTAPARNLSGSPGRVPMQLEPQEQL